MHIQTKKIFNRILQILVQNFTYETTYKVHEFQISPIPPIIVQSLGYNEEGYQEDGQHQVENEQPPQEMEVRSDR